MHYLLLHSPLISESCWDSVTPVLRRAGAEVSTVRLEHHANAEGRFHESHMDQVAKVLEQRRDEDLVVVAHSGAGKILTSFSPELFHSVVFLDAIFSLESNSRFDLFDDQKMVDSWRRNARENGGVFTANFLRALSLQIEDPVLRERFVARLAEVPLAIYEEKIGSHPAWNTYDRGLYIQWTSAYRKDAARATEAGFVVRVEAGSHFELLDSPAVVAGVISDYVEGRG